MSETPPVTKFGGGLDDSAAPRKNVAYERNGKRSNGEAEGGVSGAIYGYRISGRSRCLGLANSGLPGISVQLDVAHSNDVGFAIKRMV